jgi:hypothetical protein
MDHKLTETVAVALFGSNGEHNVFVKIEFVLFARDSFSSDELFALRLGLVMPTSAGHYNGLNTKHSGDANQDDVKQDVLNFCLFSCGTNNGQVGDRAGLSSVESHVNHHGDDRGRVSSSVSPVSKPLGNNEVVHETEEAE